MVTKLAMFSPSYDFSAQEVVINAPRVPFVAWLTGNFQK